MLTNGGRYRFDFYFIVDWTEKRTHMLWIGTCGRDCFGRRRLGDSELIVSGHFLIAWSLFFYFYESRKYQTMYRCLICFLFFHFFITTTLNMVCHFDENSLAVSKVRVDVAKIDNDE